MKGALKKEVRRWLRYASEDLDAAERMINSPESVPRHAAWLAQQATEKALKATLVFEQIEFPRTHDLSALLGLVPNRWGLSELDFDFARLSEYAVDARYPADSAEISQDEAVRSVADAARLVKPLVARIDAEINS